MSDLTLGLWAALAVLGFVVARWFASRPPGAFAQPSLALLVGGVAFGPAGLVALAVGLATGLARSRATRRVLPAWAATLALAGWATVRQPGPAFLPTLGNAVALGLVATGGLVLTQAVRQRFRAAPPGALLARVSAYHVGGGLVALVLAQAGGLLGLALAAAALLAVAAAAHPSLQAAAQAAQLASAASDARLDPLTALPNRRGLIEASAQLDASDLPVVVAILDLDHFKAINDTYGHATGDAVLFTVAQRLRAACRAPHRPTADLVGRWGGEEFVLILPRLSAATAPARVEAMRAAIGAAPIATEAGRLPVRCSIGATLCTSRWQLEAAVAQADTALYAAKAAGRDCARWSPPLTHAPALGFASVAAPPDPACPPPDGGGPSGW